MSATMMRRAARAVPGALAGPTEKKLDS